MNANAPVPERIIPLYETPEPGQEIILVQEPATLKQNEIEKHGTISVFQEWSPMSLTWEFVSDDSEMILELNYDIVEIESSSFSVKGYITEAYFENVFGYIEATVEAGNGDTLERAIFHLPNCRQILGDVVYSDSKQSQNSNPSDYWSEVLLEDEKWQIRVQPYADLEELLRKAQKHKKTVLSNVGEIRKRDRSTFTSAELDALLDKLCVFFTFAFGEWTPPLLVIGSTNNQKKAYQFWKNYDLRFLEYYSGWLVGRTGKHLAEAFNGFSSKWSNENWQEPLRLAVEWLIETKRQPEDSNGAIAFGQIPLEMLSWMVFVDDETILDKGEFKKLSASSKFHLLLSYCKIPLGIPGDLKLLNKIAKCSEFKTGPQILTKIRNSIIHPDKKNRELLAEWAKSQNASPSVIRYECKQLFEWYITLILLYTIDYSGPYRNPLSIKGLFGDTLPWDMKTKCR